MEKELLFQARLAEVTVPVERGSVRVRGLSRAEVQELRAADTSAPGSFERKMLAYALVDPAMTEDEVGRWQAASPPWEMEDVTAVASRLSALDRDQAKEAWKEFESDPDLEFRVPAGP